jgi:hypothetical protein
MKRKTQKKVPKGSKAKFRFDYRDGMYTEYGVQNNHAGGFGDFAEAVAYFLTVCLATINVFECASKVTSFQPKNGFLRHIAVGYFPLRKSYTLKMPHPTPLHRDSPLILPLRGSESVSIFQGLAAEKDPPMTSNKFK